MVRPIGSKDKIRRKFANSFARQYLADHNIQIYNGAEQVLTPVGHLYDIKLPQTRFYIGDQFMEQGETKKITSFEELRDMGFVIISLKVSSKERWTTGQKVKYEVRRIGETGEHLNKIPKDHYIEYDSYNLALRLFGPRAGRNRVGNWMTARKPKNTREGAGRKRTFKGMNENVDLLMKQQRNKLLGIEDEQEPMEIPEAAFMITDSNEIVCFPNAADMPSILITGMKRSGKCLHEDSEILENNGSLTKIRYKPEETQTLNKGLKLENAPVHKHMKRKVKKLLWIKTQQGRQIKLTHEHPLLSVLGWKPVQDFKIGDHIAVPRRYNLNLKKRMNKDRVALLAYVIAKGRLDHPKHFYFPRLRKDYTVLKNLKRVLKEFNDELFLGSFRGGKNLVRYKPFFHKIKRKHRYKYDPLKTYLEKLGLLGLKEKDKFVPNEILQLSNEHIALFISIYFSVRGFVSSDRIILHSKSERVMRHILHMLLRLEIKGTLLFHHNSWNLTIHHHEDVVRFQKCTTRYIPDYKLNRLIKKIMASKKITKYRRYDLIPGDIWKLATPKDWILAYKKLGYRYKKNQIDNLNFNIHRESLKKIAKGTNNPIFNKFAESDILWDEIISIKELKGDFIVYDMEISHPDHNFVANDIIVHNSFCMHSIIDRLFWKRIYDYKIVILNDSSKETGTWCLPNKEKEQIDMLKRLGESPLPLPVVYFHPLAEKNYDKLYMKDVGFDVTLSFKKMIEHHKEYLTLEGSTRYFAKIKEDLLECKTEKEVNQVFDEMILCYNIPPPSANKIRAEFDTIFDSKMTDISTKGQNPWSTSKNLGIEYNPITAAVHAGVLPVLETSYISDLEGALSIYFTYFVGDLFTRQKQDPDFLEEKSEILFVVDEAHNISKTGSKSPADELLRRSVREGGPTRIGTLITTQKFNELPDVIKDNSTYLICFTNPGEAGKISNQYNLGKDKTNIIKDLGKHECIAFAPGGYFVVYDTYGNRRISKLKEVFKGKSLPPYSQHKRPKPKRRN